jgi:regulator of sigma E protease
MIGLIYFVIAVIGFGILVFIHELGHFAMAKLFKIKVEVFSLGWGPKLIGYQGKETMYQIAWFPLGGFCKFKGDEMSENIEDMGKDPDSFYGTKPYKRLIVAFFGPFMNYLVAIIILGFLAMFNHNQEYTPSKITVMEKMNDDRESPSKRAGLLTGDEIIRLNDTGVYSVEEIRRFMIFNGKKDVAVTVKRDNKELEYKITPEWNSESLMYILGISGIIEPKIKYVADNPIVKYLDLKDRDMITGVDDAKFVSIYDFYLFLKNNFSTNTKAVLHILRNGDSVDKEIVFNEMNHFISMNDIEHVQDIIYIPSRSIAGKGFVPSMIQGFDDGNFIIASSAIGLYSMIFKKTKNLGNQVGGVIRTGYIMGSSTIQGFQAGIYEGIRNFLSIISLISLALAFFNLLPFPAVDGGHIVLNLYEIITRKKISMKVIYIINMIGFIILIVLALLILPLDILNISKGN